jgi:phosphohistidine phosphatase
MKLLVVRHAIAMGREDYQNSPALPGETAAAGAKNDELRPLTLEGLRKMRKGSKTLKDLVRKPDLIITSPLTRAVQTAEILLDIWSGVAIVESDALKPGAHPDELLSWFLQHPEWTKNKSLVAVIGHEPQLSHLVSWLLNGANRSLISIKKGGACLVAFDGAPRKAKGQLRFLIRCQAPF